MIRATALAFLLVATTLLAGCGIVMTGEAPTNPIEVAAPALVPVFPEVEALVAAPTRTLSLPRARALARQAALLVASCGAEPRERGFAVAEQTLVAHRGVISGSGSFRVAAATGRSTALGAASAYRAGELGVARVTRASPRQLTPARRVEVGASVVVVAERSGKLRILPGVVVDSVAGEAYGVRARVMRVTAPLAKGDVGPVLDANGRVVAVAFAVDPRTTFGVAVPVSALRGRAVNRTLEPLPACS